MPFKCVFHPFTYKVDVDMCGFYSVVVLLAGYCTYVIMCLLYGINGPCTYMCFFVAALNGLSFPYLSYPSGPLVRQVLKV